MAPRLGTHVRHLREAKGLSLRDLAARSGVSAPMLSQVERGETSPSIVVAGRIADGLDLSLSQLIRLDEPPSVSVTRAGDGVERLREGHTYSILTPTRAGQRVTVAEHRLEPGCSVAPDSTLHEPGSQEVLLVRDGTIRLDVADDIHLLDAGDAASFESDLAHHVVNPNSEPAVFISIVTSGLRQAP